MTNKDSYAMGIFFYNRFPEEYEKVLRIKAPELYTRYIQKPHLYMHPTTVEVGDYLLNLILQRIEYNEES